MPIPSKVEVRTRLVETLLKTASVADLRAPEKIVETASTLEIYIFKDYDAEKPVKKSTGKKVKKVDNSSLIS